MQDIHYIVAHRSQKEIDSFKTRYQDFDTAIIPAMVKKALRYDVVSVTPSTSWGTSHVIYYVTVKQQDPPIVLRANLGINPEPEIAMLTEQLITQKVKAIGIPTNSVLYADVSRKEYPFDFQIQEMLEGQDLENHFQGTHEDYDVLSFQLGQYIAQLSVIVFDGFGRFSDSVVIQGKLEGSKKSFFEYVVLSLEEDLTFLIQEHIISPETSHRIVRLFDEYKPLMNSSPGTLVHYDLADHNIMHSGTKITGIFDWETAISGDTLLDLASCPTWRTHYPREEKLLEGFSSIQALPDNFREKLQIYRLRTMLWKMRFAIRAGIVNAARIEKFQTALTPFHLHVLK